MKRPNKFSARRSACREAHTHASAAEARRCDELHLLERAGKITHLEVEPQFWFVIDGRQVKHPNGRRVGYKPDWIYRERDGRVVAEDKKGFRTPDFVLRAAIFRALYPHIELREV